MRRLRGFEKSRTALEVWVAVAFALLAVAILPMVRLAPAGTAHVSVTGYVRGKMTVSVSDESVDFGDPLGSAGNEYGPGSPVAAFASTDGSLDVCYLWKGEGGSGNKITVASNKPWVGYVRTADDADASGPSASGDRLRFGTSVPSNYTECSSSHFVPLQEDDYQWEGSGRKGRNSYAHYYSLTVDWTDPPATFNPTIVYTVYQY